jgi:hypothetical protein
VGVGDRLDDRQPEPRAVRLACAVGRKALERPGEAVDRTGVDDGAGVGDRQNGDVAASPRGHIDPAGVRVVGKGIVGQVRDETLDQARIVGALAGIGLGYAATALISALVSTLTATAAAAPGTSEPHGFIGGANARTGQSFHQTTLFPGTYSSAPVHFTAPVALSVVALAAALGIAGGLLAGALAGWRAARLRPTVALAHAG